MATVKKNTKSTGDVKSLSSQLKGVASVAKSLGIDTRKADAMVKQTERQGSESFSGSREEKAYLKDIQANPIPVTNLNPASPVNLPPTPPVPSLPQGTTPTDLSTYYGLATTTTDTATAPGTQTQTTDPFLQAMQMQKDLFEQESPNAAKELRRLERDYDLSQRQADVNLYKGQLGAITAQAQADKLKLEDQGRGIPEPIILGQQARIDREAAIRALPIAAQLDAAQNDLQMVEQRIDRLFQVRMADAQAQYNFKSKVIDSIANYADKQEQRRLEEVRYQQQIKLQKEEALFSRASTIALQAFENGQSTLGSRIMAIDFSQPTAVDEFQRLSAQVQKPMGTTKRDTAFDKDGNLVDMQTGEIITRAGGGAIGEQQQTQMNEMLTLARDLLKDGGFWDKTGKSSAVGASLAKFVPFGMSLGLQGDRASFENKVNTLKANLTLENLSLLKGPMSDKDLAFLQAIGSSLSTNMSEKSFNQEMTRIVNKIEERMANPVVSGSRIITAPDGTQVEIID